MKNMYRLFFLAIVALLFSCEDTPWYTDCSDCTAEEPGTANLVVKLTATDLPIIIRIYEGDLQDSVLYSITEDFRGNKYKKQVALNKKYTVTAEYRINDNIYLAIDSCTPRVKYTKDQCNEPCYFLYDRIVDLRLKYTADKSKL